MIYGYLKSCRSCTLVDSGNGNGEAMSSLLSHKPCLDSLFCRFIFQVFVSHQGSLSFQNLSKFILRTGHVNDYLDRSGYSLQTNISMISRQILCSFVKSYNKVILTFLVLQCYGGRRLTFSPGINELKSLKIWAGPVYSNGR